MQALLKVTELTVPLGPCWERLPLTKLLSALWCVFGGDGDEDEGDSAGMAKTASLPFNPSS